jgi:hypothetical protein
LKLWTLFIGQRNVCLCKREKRRELGQFLDNGGSMENETTALNSYFGWTSAGIDPTELHEESDIEIAY